MDRRQADLPGVMGRLGSGSCRCRQSRSAMPFKFTPSGGGSCSPLTPATPVQFDPVPAAAGEPSFCECPRPFAAAEA